MFIEKFLCVGRIFAVSVIIIDVAGHDGTDGPFLSGEKLLDFTLIGSALNKRTVIQM